MYTRKLRILQTHENPGQAKASCIFCPRLPISEYGGIRWIKNTTEGWGYGNALQIEQEFFDRYKGLTEAMLNNKEIFGYTQLYDIEQEINGLYTYQREEKFDINVIKTINIQKAAIED